MERNDLFNLSLELPNGKFFTVLQLKSYKEKEIEKRHKNILALQSGYLACVKFRGALIPNIRLNDGIAELVSIKMNEKILSTPGDISYALGVKNNADFYLIQIIKEPVGL